jgi:hypothetical protein
MPEQWPAGGNKIIIQLFNSTIAAVGLENSTCPQTDNNETFVTAASVERRFIPNNPLLTF